MKVLGRLRQHTPSFSCRKEEARAATRMRGGKTWELRPLH